jgi:hypothetical protein
MPESISGSNGHNALFAAATSLVHGFELSPETAFALLINEFNPRCQPSWSEKEIRHKIEDASAKNHNQPRGWLKNASRENLPATAASITEEDFENEPEEEEYDIEPPPDELFTIPGLVSEIMEYSKMFEFKSQPAFRLFAAVSAVATLTSRKLRDIYDTRTASLKASRQSCGHWPLIPPSFFKWTNSANFSRPCGIRETRTSNRSSGRFLRSTHHRTMNVIRQPVTRTAAKTLSFIIPASTFTARRFPKIFAVPSRKTPSRKACFQDS